MGNVAAPPSAGPVTRASAADTLRVVAGVLVPLAARGLILRRPAVVGTLARVDADRRAVRLLQRLRRRYGEGPLLLRLPGRRLVLVLAPGDAWRVLRETPDPFTAANREKRAALSRFQPHGVLVSRGPERAPRRAVNDDVLDSGAEVHREAAALVPKVREEAALLLEASARSGQLTWDAFASAWWRGVRRVVLGDAARDDATVTDALAALRAHGNWAYLRPESAARTARFDALVRRAVERAEPGSLAGLVARVTAAPGVVPHQQVPQWLFAFDAAGIAIVRTLALLDAHRDHLATVRAELRDRGDDDLRPLYALRAAVLESLRLWPTTPGILRDTTAVTTWEGSTLPADTAVLVYAPYFHRDDERLAEAHRYAPQLWAQARDAGGSQQSPELPWPLVPFSAGSAACPGRNLVLTLTSEVLAVLLDHHDLAPAPRQRLRRDRPLLGTLDPFRLRFAVVAG